MKFYTALFVGLTAVLSIANADVSHLSKTQQAGHSTYVANDGRVVKQSFNSAFSATSHNGNAQNPTNKYWWTNSQDTHYTPQKVQYSSNGCSRCAASSNTVHLKRQNTQQHFSQNNNINGHYITRSPYTQQQHHQQPKAHQIQNTYKSAHISGSPRDVNNYFTQQQSSRLTQQSTPCTDSNSACVAPKFCFNGVIDQLVENKASRSTSGRCNAPEVCCRFAQRKSANFKVFALDSVASPAQSTSEVLTNEGYVVRKPTNTYLPVPEYNPAPSNDDPAFLRPTTRPPPPRTTRPPPPPPPQRPPPPPPQRPLIPQPSEPRPSRPIEPAPIVIPVGCSAAMNCTRIEMCSAIGVISKTPVILTPEQQLFRVPLTECLHPQTKEPGVCCRDPDYTDPWPVGRTGQYVPEELNKVFDNGAYKPETTNVDIVRVKPPSEGYVIPQPSNTQSRLYLPPRSNQI